MGRVVLLRITKITKNLVRHKVWEKRNLILILDIKGQRNWELRVKGSNCLSRIPCES